MRNKILLFLLAFIGISQIAAASAVRDKYNFNSEWLLYVGDIPEAKVSTFSGYGLEESNITPSF